VVWQQNEFLCAAFSRMQMGCDGSPAESVLRRGQVETDGSGSRSRRNSGRAASDPVRTQPQGSSSQSFPIRRTMRAARAPVDRYAGPAVEKTRRHGPLLHSATTHQSTPAGCCRAQLLYAEKATAAACVPCPRAHGMGVARCRGAGDQGVGGYLSTAQSSDQRPAT
jgi:hypothetical protein